MMEGGNEGWKEKGKEGGKEGRKEGKKKGRRERGTDGRKEGRKAGSKIRKTSSDLLRSKQEQTILSFIRRNTFKDFLAGLSLASATMWLISMFLIAPPAPPPPPPPPPYRPDAPPLLGGRLASHLRLPGPLLPVGLRRLGANQQPALGHGVPRRRLLHHVQR